MLETSVPAKVGDDQRDNPPTLVVFRGPKENFDLVNQLISWMLES